MHLSDTIGGWSFYNEDFSQPNVEIRNENGTEVEYKWPRFVDQGVVTADVFGNYDARLLEINSKTGLYPLYLTYSLYKLWKTEYVRYGLIDKAERDDKVIWDSILNDNIFVVCKTPMARAITRRTLVGFRRHDGGREIQVNAVCPYWTVNKAELVKKKVIKVDENEHISSNDTYLADLVEMLRFDSKIFERDVVRPEWWEKVDCKAKIKLDRKIFKNMIKFDAVVGNPPYQESIDSSRSLAKQIFPSFIESGIKLAPCYFSLITPARWFTADAQDNSFPKLREFVRANNHFSIMVTHNGKKLFPNTELSMVDYFLWESNYVGDVKFIENIGESTNSLIRPLFEKELDIIIPQNNIISFIQKIKVKDFSPLNTITTGRDAFGIVGKNFENRSKSEKFTGSVAVQGAYEQIRYIERSEVKKGHDFLDSYKVFTSKGNGGAGLLTDGKPVTIIGKAFIGSPGMACTDSLIPFGKFKILHEAKNLQKYMRTKFLRFCVGILKVSQNLYQNVYAFVPLQDFTKNSDIDWNQSIEEIDRQLYKKYELDHPEIDFIEKMIKPMD